MKHTQKLNASTKKYDCRPPNILTKKSSKGQDMLYVRPEKTFSCLLPAEKQSRLCPNRFQVKVTECNPCFMLGYFLRCGTLYFVLAKYNYGERIIRYSYKIFNMNFFFSFTIIPDLEERDSRKRFPSKVFFFLTLIKHWMREKKE